MKKLCLGFAFLGCCLAVTALEGEKTTFDAAKASYETLKYEMSKRIYTRFLGRYYVRKRGTSNCSDIRRSDICPIFPDVFCCTLDYSGLNNEQKAFFCREWMKVHKMCLMLSDPANPNDPCRRGIVTLLAVMADLRQASRRKNNDWNKVYEELKRKYEGMLVDLW